MEIGTRQLDNILEISDQIQDLDKDFIDVEAYFVHSGPFWVISGHAQIKFSEVCNFFLRDLWYPRVLFYDILFANNFVYCFWIVLCLIAKFWFSFLMIIWSTSDIMTQNQWKSMEINKNHWFSLILSHNIRGPPHYHQKRKWEYRDER